MVVDMPPDIRSLPAGASGEQMPPGAVEIDNTFGGKGYGGPQPPRGTGAHTYEARLYALDVPRIDIEQDADLGTLEQAVSGHVLAEATYSGVMG
jgi:Raf kinase inhibitor-like YbhB/YbcL family protein